MIGYSKPVEFNEAITAVSVTTRITTRRVRFVDQLSNGRPTERNEESCEDQEIIEVCSTRRDPIKSRESSITKCGEQ